MVVSPFLEGDQTWVEYWRERLDGKVVQVESRVDVLNVRDVNIDDSSFKAKVLCYFRIDTDALYDHSSDRLGLPGKMHYVESNGQAIQEFTPWLEITTGTLLHKWTWVREDKDAGKLIYALEMDGTFPLGKHERGLLYPFDFHKLKMQVTSNWDADTLVFRPWDCNWDEETSLRACQQHTHIVDDQVSRMRKEDIKATMRTKWKINYSAPPRLTFTMSKGFHSSTYSEVHAAIMVERRPLVHILYELLRPLALAMLAPLSLYFFPATDSIDRVAYNVSLLVAMSLAFLRGSSERVTLSDVYKVLMFVFSSIVVGIVALPSLDISFGDAAAKGVAWGLLLAFHAAIVLWYIYVFPARVTMRHSFATKNSTTVKGASKKLGGRGGGMDQATVHIKDAED